MGVKFGDIDSRQIIENEFQIGVLKILVQKLLQQSPNLAPETEMQKIRQHVARQLKRKYPNTPLQLSI